MVSYTRHPRENKYHIENGLKTLCGLPAVSCVPVDVDEAPKHSDICKNCAERAAQFMKKDKKMSGTGS